jgi:hypothetical protein
MALHFHIEKLLFEESEVSLYSFSGGDELMSHCTPQKQLGKHPYLMNKSNNRRAE